MNEVESQLQTSQEESLNEKLLRGLKKEVKHIMEESVMLKCVHEDSASITSLCLSVDACLSYGLKRRALGLFKTRYEMEVEELSKHYLGCFQSTVGQNSSRPVIA